MVIFEGEGGGFTHYGDLCPADYPGAVQSEDGKAFCQLTSIWMLQKGFFQVFNAWADYLKRRSQAGRVKEPKTCMGWVTVLDAHGDTSRGEWKYKNCKDDRSTEFVPTQQWVDSQDGNTVALVLLCCNPRNRGIIRSKHSLVIHARGSLTEGGFFSRRARLTMYVPGFGYITAKQKEELERFLAEIRQAPARGPRSHLRLITQ
jgi:hypothetical protein